MSDDSELLDYQTETEDEETIVPVPVEGTVVTVPTVPQHASCYTLVADSDESKYQELLPLDPLRVRATILVEGQPVVICDNRSQAAAAANQEASTPRPSGAYIYASSTVQGQIVITSTCQMWVAATSATAARVSVIVERRSAG